jgi:hypothetical protein
MLSSLLVPSFYRLSMRRMTREDDNVAHREKRGSVLTLRVNIKRRQQ